jgi:GGDEF domain-containing protein
MMTQNQQTIAAQQALIHKLAWNDGFGCHTRKGFEHVVWPGIAAKARSIVYFDIDGMHALNEKFGSYEPVDAMIRKVLSSVRSSDFVAGQWKSGDEFLICLTENDKHNTLDPEGLVRRLTEEFAKVGMSATFAIVPVKSTDLLENVQPAVDQVYEAKKSRGHAAR